MVNRILLPLLGAAVCFVFGGRAAADPPSEQGIRFFESKVRPLLIEHCYDCHGEDSQEGQLRLDTYAGLIGGGISGATVAPGNPEESLLLSAISFEDEALQMPPDGKLSDQEIATLTEWIRSGAPHPDAGDAPSQPLRRGSIDIEEAKKFWAFQPVVRPEVPALASSWINHPIDAFILQAAQSQGLQIAPPADKATLIRRATFDLTGLPPTPEAVAEFLSDDAPDAYTRLIDRLLSSEQYGQRWGRHWLDVARYADSNGLDENIAHGNAWRYRDYVVDAFNRDKPYNDFVLEQVAGDLVVAQQRASREQTGEPAADGDAANGDTVEPLTPEEIEKLIATGFLVLGPKVIAEGDQDKLQMDVIDEQVDTLGRAMLGLTIGCARCHDHKFDPISIADYYSLAGIFKSTRTMESLKRIAKWNENTIATAEQIAEKQRYDQALAAKKAEIEALLTQTSGEGEAAKTTKVPEDKLSPEQQAELKQLREQLAQLEQNAVELPSAMGVQEGEVADTRIHVRGSHLTLGRTVPRALPEVLTPEQSPEIAEDESGRLQLAQWLADDENPLTPRVMVNRLWRWHFGRGLVSTTDNFGNLGETPSNPPLLDWLAAELIQSDWSLKVLHRQVMLSSTYQLSSESNTVSAAIDPDNRFHWRAEIRRLEAEALRDSLLVISGLLDPHMGGSLLHVKNRAFLFDHTSKDNTSYDSYRRSLYLPVIRNNLYDGFTLFDYTSADVPNGDRETSTVATQALLLLNSDLVIEAAEALAKRLTQQYPDDEARVRALYRLAVSRDASQLETDRLLDFLARMQQHVQTEGASPPESHQIAWTVACQSLLASNEFIYVR